MALSIGSLGIRIRPPKGWSSSKIKKMAQATEKAEATKASVVVAFGGATRLKSTGSLHARGPPSPLAMGGPPLVRARA